MDCLSNHFCSLNCSLEVGKMSYKKNIRRNVRSGYKIGKRGAKMSLGVGSQLASMLSVLIHPYALVVYVVVGLLMCVLSILTDPSVLSNPIQALIQSPINAIGSILYLFMILVESLANIGLFILVLGANALGSLGIGILSTGLSAIQGLAFGLSALLATVVELVLSGGSFVLSLIATAFSNIIPWVISNLNSALVIPATALAGIANMIRSIPVVGNAAVNFLVSINSAWWALDADGYVTVVISSSPFVPTEVYVDIHSGMTAFKNSALEQLYSYQLTTASLDAPVEYAPLDLRANFRTLLESLGVRILITL